MLVSSVLGVSQATILAFVAISFSRDLPDPGIEPGSPSLQVDSYQCTTGKPLHLFGGCAEMLFGEPVLMSQTCHYDVFVTRKLTNRQKIV